MDMIKRKTWEEFQKVGLLWFINRLLHLFGWAIVYKINDKTKKIIEVYPAKCKFRGFDSEYETEGFKKITYYLKNNINNLIKDINIK